MLLIIHALLWTCPKNYCGHCERNSFSSLTYQCKHMSLVHMAFTDLCRDAVDGIAPLVHGQLVACLHLPSLSFGSNNMKMSRRFAKYFTNKLVFTFQIMCKDKAQLSQSVQMDCCVAFLIQFVDHKSIYTPLQVVKMAYNFVQTMWLSCFETLHDLQYKRGSCGNY